MCQRCVQRKRQAQTEPDAATRKTATALWEFFVALTCAGFTDEQAMEILTTTIITNGGSSA